MTRPEPAQEARAVMALVGWLFVCAILAALALGFCAPRPSEVHAEALRPSHDACVKGHAAMLFEAADLADAFRRLGSTCRTPAAIRARVRTGYMSPDDRTPRGGALWTADGLQRELLHEARLIRYFGADTSRRLQRWYSREPVQLSIQEVA